MITIVGAGFSGLSLAYFFTKKGYKVRIVEKSHRVGGVIDTELIHQIPVETAANGFLASRKVEDLFKDIGVDPIIPIKESKVRFIFRSYPRRWPLTLIETLMVLKSLLGALITGQFPARAGETLSSWGDRVLGPAGTKYLLQPMVNGIFAQAVSQLSARLVLGSLLWKKQKGRRSGLISAKDGMKQVIVALRAYLELQGVVFETQSNEYSHLENWESVSELIKRQHNTFLAIPLSVYKSTKTEKNLLNFRSLLRVTIVPEDKNQKINGFGILFPQAEKFKALGVLSNTKIFAHRGSYNESWIFSDGNKMGYLPKTQDEIKSAIEHDRARVFGVSGKVDVLSVHPWRQVFPDYNFELESWLNSHSMELNSITGNFCGVLGLSGIHERNFDLVERYFQKYGKE